MISRIGVAVMAVCLVIYLAVAGLQGIRFIQSGQPIGVIMGIAVLGLPILGGWALYRELQFGRSSERLAKVLDAEGLMPEAETPLTPSGHIARGHAEPVLARYLAEAEAQPDSWRAHFRLGVVQDAASKRRDARASIRRAIAAEKGESAR